MMGQSSVPQKNNYFLNKHTKAAFPSVWCRVLHQEWFQKVCFLKCLKMVLQNAISSGCYCIIKTTDAAFIAR
jgi:hypothetical protein